MAKHAGAYRSEKRKKEVSRQKKQEEKRQRRLNKGGAEKQDGEIPDAGDSHADEAGSAGSDSVQ